MFRDFFETMVQAWIIVKERRRKVADVVEKRNIARVFNDRYTYRIRLFDNDEYLPGTGMYGTSIRGGYAWMCPECNKIHEAVKISALTGLQYPKCCSYTEGHRLDEKIKTKRN